MLLCGKKVSNDLIDWSKGTIDMEDIHCSIESYKQLIELCLSGKYSAAIIASFIQSITAHEFFFQDWKSTEVDISQIIQLSQGIDSDKITAANDIQRVKEKGKEEIEILTSLLEDDLWEVRRAAIASIASIPPIQLKDIMVTLTNNHKSKSNQTIERDIDAEIIAVLHTIRKATYEHEIKARIGELGKLLNKTNKPLPSILLDLFLHFPIDLMKPLRMMKVFDENVINQLCNLLKNENKAEDIRMEAATTLGEIPLDKKEKEVELLLKKCLEGTSHKKLRRRSGLSLMKITKDKLSEEAKEKVIEVIFEGIQEDDDWFGKEQSCIAARYLPVQGKEKVLQLVFACLADPNEDVKREAARTITIFSINKLFDLNNVSQLLENSISP